MPVAVLVSGSGTTLQNLLNEQRHETLPIEIRFVLSSRPDAFALERARRAGIRTAVLDPRRHAGPADYGRAIIDTLAPCGPRLILMAGFLPLWHIPPDWLGRVLNIHPSLLPAFGGKGMYGDRVHRAVLRYGCRVTGCTVHMADNIYDHGPVLVQRVVWVLDGDRVETLRARVFREECIAYPQAIRLLAEGRVVMDGRRARLVPPAHARSQPAAPACEPPPR
ncbi:MAG: phosphoribosylglycinamide formyltransferase [Planctomycetota bacterium]|nr:MAG: phosphoribosylglycinamide formyltransferase [Planctomycetota bacterium]